MMFQTIAEYYQYIEEDNNLSYDHSLSQKVRALFDKIENAVSKKECSYELYFLDFKIQKGEVKLNIDKGQRIGYPSFDLFDDNLDYIKQRAETVVNPKYKAKYNHLLWGSCTAF